MINTLISKSQDLFQEARDLTAAKDYKAASRKLWMALALYRGKCLSVAAFIRTIKFGACKPHHTCHINIQSGDITVNPGFLLTYVLQMEDLVALILHERGHLLLGELFKRKNRTVTLKENWVQDSYINQSLKTLVKSDIFERFYAKQKSHLPLTQRLEDFEAFAAADLKLDEDLVEELTLLMQHAQKQWAEWPKYSKAFTSLYDTIRSWEKAEEKAKEEQAEDDSDSGKSEDESNQDGDSGSQDEDEKEDSDLFEEGTEDGEDGEEGEDESKAEDTDGDEDLEGDLDGEDEGEGTENDDSEDETATEGEEGESVDGEDDESDTSQSDSEDGEDSEGEDEEDEDGESSEEDEKSSTDEDDSETSDSGDEDAGEGEDKEEDEESKEGDEEEPSEDLLEDDTEPEEDMEEEKGAEGCGNCDDYRDITVHNEYNIDKDKIDKITNLDKLEQDMNQWADSPTQNIGESIDPSKSPLRAKIIVDSVARILKGTSNSPPSRPSNKDLMLLAAGHIPMEWDVTMHQAEKQWALFCDVSSSVQEWWPQVLAVAKSLRRFVSRVYQFSDYVVDVTKDRDPSKLVTSHGTNFGAVASEILAKKYQNVIIVTDNEGSLNKITMVHLKRQIKTIILVPVGSWCKSGWYGQGSWDDFTLPKNILHGVLDE